MIRRNSVCSYIILLILVLCTSSCQQHQKNLKRSTPYIIAYPRNWSSIPLYGAAQHLTGFSSDLLYEIAKAEKIQIRLVAADINLFPSLLKSRAVDAVLTALPVNTITKQFYDFSIPYFMSGTIVVVSSQSPYTTTQEFTHVDVAFDRSEGLDITLGARLSWALKPYESISLALEDIMKGKIDGVLLNFLNANRLNKSFYRARFKILLPPVVQQNIRLAVLRGENQEFLEFFNHQLEELIQQGTYEKLLQYWNIKIP